MITLDDVRETVSVRREDDFPEAVDASDAAPNQPIEVSFVPEWMPVDPARSIEAAVIAALLVAGWVLAIWAYVRLTN